MYSNLCFETFKILVVDRQVVVSLKYSEKYLPKKGLLLTVFWRDHCNNNSLNIQKLIRLKSSTGFTVKSNNNQTDVLAKTDKQWTPKSSFLVLFVKSINSIKRGEKKLSSENSWYKYCKVIWCFALDQTGIVFLSGITYFL